MKRKYQHKASHLDVLRSIRFKHGAHDNFETYPKEHFASFVPQARSARVIGPEDSQLVRSAN